MNQKQNEMLEITRTDAITIRTVVFLVTKSAMMGTWRFEDVLLSTHAVSLVVALALLDIALAAFFPFGETLAMGPKDSTVAY
jgi:multisubunit Na+/H+ antiporter MnhG subunit